MPSAFPLVGRPVRVLRGLASLAGGLDVRPTLVHRDAPASRLGLARAAEAAAGRGLLLALTPGARPLASGARTSPTRRAR